VLPEPFVLVRNRAEFVAQISKRGRVAAAFVDLALIPQVESERHNVPIVGLLDRSASPALTATINALSMYPWLAHLIAAPMLETPFARAHLTLLVERLVDGAEQAVLGPSGIGRVALLARASRREQRFERMQEFFAKQGMSARTLSTLHEIAEELVMNALYDAPLEAGYLTTPVPRTEDIAIPPDRACEISYGIERGNAFVRVRDPFGALQRTRLFEVLNRCNHSGVTLDESRGGAGLGLWRVFTTASTVAITVVPGRITDILVGVATKSGRMLPGLLATHFFFAQESTTNRPQLAEDDDRDLFDESITLVVA
jgi:hypothetical protein